MSCPELAVSTGWSTPGTLITGASLQTANLLEIRNGSATPIMTVALDGTRTIHDQEAYDEWFHNQQEK
jgi:hypothetical protein